MDSSISPSVKTESITAKDIKKLPLNEVIVVRRKFRLIVRTRLSVDSIEYKQTYSCRCAHGAMGFGTPTGTFPIFKKESPPTYTAPDRKWARDAGFKPGEKLPHDHPANPLAGAFLWLTEDGIGIHGTNNLLSLGTRASHGCVRVKPEAAIYLFENIALGTIVDII
jgi:lipoprotein-anchoring transpeptidase ErfK/SrfK